MENQFFFDKLGMKLSGKRDGAFGDSVELFSGTSFSLRLVIDKGSKYIEIASHANPDDWFDVALLKAMLKGEKVSGKPTPIQILQEFLLDNLPSIEEALTPAAHLNTQEKLKVLGKERARLMFPNAYK